MKVKEKKFLFLCELGEANLKVIKCLVGRAGKREFVGVEIRKVTSEMLGGRLTEEFNHCLKKLDYTGHPLIISLPRSQATCRYLKVPAQTRAEIEKIIPLQAPRYLPYPAEELITGYQSISTDKEGYTGINLVIVHKDVISRYLQILEGLNAKQYAIILSSYGICNFYHYIQPNSSDTVTLIDIDSSQAEIAILCNKKLLFSRYFRLNKFQPGWEDLLITELNKTQDAYLKETLHERPSKVIIVSAKKSQNPKALEILKRQTNLPIEVLYYPEIIGRSEGVINGILNAEDSFVNLVGLALEKPDASLNLLPEGIKQKTQDALAKKESLFLALGITVTILILGLAALRTLQNKSNYLMHIKQELNKISQEAKPLEEIEKRMQLVAGRLQKKPLIVDVLYGLYQCLPSNVALVNFSYTENEQITLRGQTQELNSVFAVVSQLEKSAAFKNFNLKVRYATKKKTQAGEIVDFEIICLKK